jgi:hypothetical protein
MRVAWIFLFGSLVFLSTSGQLNCQQATAVQRDPQAVAILTLALNASGGASVIAGISDFTAIGNITYYWGEPIQGSVTVQGRGLHEFRVDASLPDGVHSSITNAIASFQRNPDRSTSPLPSQNTRRLVAASFPAFHILAAFQDASVSVTYGGQVLHNGQQVHDIIVRKTFSTNGDPGGALSSISKAHIFIDPNALTVQSIVDTAYRRDGGPGEYPHEMQFSAYQAVNGILVPFSVSEFVAGQHTMAIQLSRVTFNSGLTDSAFE